MGRKMNDVLIEIHYFALNSVSNFPKANTSRELDYLFVYKKKLQLCTTISF